MSEANDLAHRLHLSKLYDAYGALLTPKQRQCLELYFFDDLSLGEIAAECSVSRQAVHDTIRKVSNLLEHYEESLGFVAQMEQLRSLVGTLGESLGTLKERYPADRDLDKAHSALTELVATLA